MTISACKRVLFTPSLSPRSRSEMGIHFSPCGRFMACCVLRDSPSEASVRWHAARAAAVAAQAAAAASETHVHPGAWGSGADLDSDEDGDAEAGVEGFHGGDEEMGELGSPTRGGARAGAGAGAGRGGGPAAMAVDGEPAADGPNSPDSRRSVEMADAGGWLGGDLLVGREGLAPGKALRWAHPLLSLSVRTDWALGHEGACDTDPRTAVL